MAQNFLSCDREQELLLPPSLRDWLGEEHFVWGVLDAVETIHLAGFTAHIGLTAMVVRRTIRR